MSKLVNRLRIWSLKMRNNEKKYNLIYSFNRIISEMKIHYMKLTIEDNRKKCSMNLKTYKLSNQKTIKKNKEREQREKILSYL